MTDSENQPGSQVEDPKLDSVDFRHLSAFQSVYQEKSYTGAGLGIPAARKSIVRMIQNLERDFDCRLFIEGSRGQLVPTPFAERLFNDLRFLNTARHRMKDHICAIHESGRVLHVGSSAAVFRTQEFRALFRELQTADGIRACYCPIDSADAGKALVSGHCDLFIGCWSGKGSRFVTHEAGGVFYQFYRRGPGGAQKDLMPRACVVSLYNQVPDLPPVPDGCDSWGILNESQWLYWLDHAEECPNGTLILGPEMQVDPGCWQVVENQPESPVSQRLHVSFLRQHPYEFLPALARKIQNRIVEP
ncbi:MAG: LysR family transcriptional regulator [Verrucomicrobiota bacterium]